MNKTKLRKTSYSEAGAGITEEKTGLRALFPYYREKDEILQEIYSNPQLESLLPVQKLLLRLGEANREEIRRRVTEFAKLMKLYAE